MNIQKYLPIGSVVLLNNAEKRVMVIGFKIEENGQNFDYVGCLYPEGLKTLKMKLLFNHNQINQIYYLGYNDKEWKDFALELLHK